VKPAAPPPRLDPRQARFRADVAALNIRSTADVEPSSELGDERGRRALTLALGTRGAGYHAFVCGVEGPERLERIAEIVRPLMRADEPLHDWVYVHDFRNPNRPRALQLAAGDGRRLRSELASLVDGLREDLPKAFREEAFDEERSRIADAYQKRHEEAERHLRELAEREGFALRIAPQGNVLLVPVADGKPIESEEQFRALGPERIGQLEEAHKRVLRELRDYFEEHREERHRLDQEIGAIEREFAGRIVRSRAAALAGRFDGARLEEHVDAMVEHILHHLDPFRGQPETPSFLPPFLTGVEPDPLSIYEVNVVVDNSRREAPPVVVVDSPTYKNLFGAIDREIDRAGRVTTDFRRIQAGALLEADGGVVVLQAEDALVEPFVWRILRRALRSGRIEIEAYDPFVGFTVTALRPQPIRVSTKVVLLGPRWLFEMLLSLDTEFADLFKVMADFAAVVDRNDETTRALCGRISGLVRRDGLLAFDAGALDALVELAVREASDRSKLSLGSERLLDAAREAEARARSADRESVAREDVLEALRERIHRLDRIEQRLREATAEGVLLVDVTGAAAGQVNALSVSELGGYAFGRPTRVTASFGLGVAGVVSIDRETKLSGATHDKGVLILEGFLRDRFARGRPLSLSASVVFEQSYAHVEGDSASLAELLAILSRVGGFPLRQDLAVTGSVNQLGEVQAIGGVNEKIAGFYDCCRAKGLTGEQGVVFPASNVAHLALRDDVADAVDAGRFHLHPVRNVDEALETFTGLAAGAPDEPDTLSFVVDRALEELARRMAEFGKALEKKKVD
jgi:predicted ATP-dependent protease